MLRYGSPCGYSPCLDLVTIHFGVCKWGVNYSLRVLFTYCKKKIKILFFLNSHTPVWMVRDCDSKSRPFSMIHTSWVRPSIHYPPISDVFVNKEYFFCIIQMIQLWHYWEIACSISRNKINHCNKKHLKCVSDCM